MVVLEHMKKTALQVCKQVGYNQGRRNLSSAFAQGARNVPQKVSGKLTSPWKWIKWPIAAATSYVVIDQLVDASTLNLLYSTLLRPVVNLLDPETAHNLGIQVASLRILPRGRCRADDSPMLAVRALGMSLDSPIGLAAGFDKHAEAPLGLLKFGFSYIECGSVTPNPQEGNPRPRLWRLPDSNGIINQFGFNSKGLGSFLENINAALPGVPQGKAIGVNLGKDRLSEDAGKDYALGLSQIQKTDAGYVVVNVSSPNTPGLRSLQKEEALRKLLFQVTSINTGPNKKPLLVKISPDMSESDLASVVSVVQDLGLDGIVVSNTTVDRSAQVRTEWYCREPADSLPAGGLSGLPLRDKAHQTLRKVYQLSGGNILLIGVGGIMNGEDAYRRIRSGASLVQIYSVFALQGPWVVRKIKAELEECLAKDGFSSVQDAVGADFPEIQKKGKRPSTY